MRSSRKPYYTWEGPRKFFSSPSRHLKESNAKESSFEKPYLTSNYNTMHQEPNLPAVPDGALNPGGIEISFVDGACGYGIKAIAGITIPTIGGPEEDKAGWLAPRVSIGEIVSWKTSGPGLRRIDVAVNVDSNFHIIELTFKDGWGKLHTSLIKLNCSVANWTIPVGYSSPLRLIYSLALTLDKAWGSYTDTIDYSAWVISSSPPYTNWSGEDTGIVANNIVPIIYLDGAGSVFLLAGNTSDEFLFISKIAGVWTSTVLDSSDSLNASYTPKAVIDSTGKIHIVMTMGDAATAEIRYVTNKSGTWRAYTVNAVEAAGDSPTFATICEIAGIVYICYLYNDISESTTEIRCRFGSEESESISWTQEIIKTVAWGGGHSSYIGSVVNVAGVAKLSYTYNEYGVATDVEIATRNGANDWGIASLYSAAGGTGAMWYTHILPQSYFYTAFGEEIILCDIEIGSDSELYEFRKTSLGWVSSIIPWSQYGYSPFLGGYSGFDVIGAAINKNDRMLLSGLSVGVPYYYMTYKDF